MAGCAVVWCWKMPGLVSYFLCFLFEIATSICNSKSILIQHTPASSAHEGGGKQGEAETRPAGDPFKKSRLNIKLKEHSKTKHTKHDVAVNLKIGTTACAFSICSNLGRFGGAALAGDATTSIGLFGQVFGWQMSCFLWDNGHPVVVPQWRVEGIGRIGPEKGNLTMLRIALMVEVALSHKIYVNKIQ